jgi:hypothetical protein
MVRVLEMGDVCQMVKGIPSEGGLEGEEAEPSKRWCPPPRLVVLGNLMGLLLGLLLMGQPKKTLGIISRRGCLNVLAQAIRQVENILADDVCNAVRVIDRGSVHLM